MSSLIILLNTLVDKTPTVFPYAVRYFFPWIVLFISLSNDLRGVWMKSIILSAHSWGVGENPELKARTKTASSVPLHFSISWPQATRQRGSFAFYMQVLWIPFIQLFRQTDLQWIKKVLQSQAHFLSPKSYLGNILGVTRSSAI